MTDQRFHEGDVLTFRGNEYRVETVDITHDGRVLQYRLDARDGPPATLLPDHETGDYAVKEFHQVGGDDITVIE